MLQIPGVDDLSPYLYRATQKKRVVNASAGESSFRSLLDGRIVFSLIESDDIETVAHFLNEKKGLIGRNDVLDWQCCHAGVNLGKRVQSAGRFLFVGRGD